MYIHIYIYTCIYRELLDLGGLQTLVGILGQTDAPVKVRINRCRYRCVYSIYRYRYRACLCTLLAGSKTAAAG